MLTGEKKIKKEKIKTGIILAIIIILICIYTIPNISGSIIRMNPIYETINGNILYVGGTGPGNYTKIQDAIDNSTEGDTVFVFSGTYYESILIWKSISLVGENKENTILFPGAVEQNDNSTIFISADNSSIKGFTIVFVVYLSKKCKG